MVQEAKACLDEADEAYKSIVAELAGGVIAAPAAPASQEQRARFLSVEDIVYGQAKALDFIDSRGPSLRIFNVCRARARYDARLGNHCSCGFAFPNKLWHRPNKNKFAFSVRSIGECWSTN